MIGAVIYRFFPPCHLPTPWEMSGTAEASDCVLARPLSAALLHAQAWGSIAPIGLFSSARQTHVSFGCHPSTVQQGRHCHIMQQNDTTRCMTPTRLKHGKDTC